MKFRTIRIWIYTRDSMKWSGITFIHLLNLFNAVQKLRYQSWDQVPCWIQSFSVHIKHSLFILDCWHPQVPSCPNGIRHQREHFVRGGDPGLRDQGGGRQGRAAPLLRHPPVWHPGQRRPGGRRQLPPGHWWSAASPPVSVSGGCPEEHQLA